MQSERDELIEGLKMACAGSPRPIWEDIAIFILKDRKRIVDPLVKARERIMNKEMHKIVEPWESNSILDPAINEVLKRAGIDN